MLLRHTVDLARVRAGLREGSEEYLGAAVEEALRLQSNYAAAHAHTAWCYELRFARAGRHDADRITALRHARAALSRVPSPPSTTTRSQ